MKSDQIKEKVEAYLTRSVTKYELNEEGVFRITGAESGDLSQDKFNIIDRRELGFVQGKFVDAIAYALDLPLFYYEWDNENPASEKAGYLKKINIKDAPVLEQLLE